MLGGEVRFTEHALAEMAKDKMALVVASPVWLPQPDVRLPRCVGGVCGGDAGGGGGSIRRGGGRPPALVPVRFDPYSRGSIPIAGTKITF